MVLIACIDSKGGMMFNRRRQSRDRLLRQDLLEEAGGRTVWMSPYSRGQFDPGAENVRAAEDFPQRAGEDGICFFEDGDPGPWLERADGLILYHWNRAYPADQYFPLPLAGWTLARREEFPGSSHERITKEVFVRSER